MGAHEQVVNIRARQHGTFGPSQNVMQALTQGLRHVQRVLDQQRIPAGDRFYIISARIVYAMPPMLSFSPLANGAQIKHGPRPF